MHVFWLNGNLVFEPENEFEREALGLLSDNVKWGRSQRNDPGVPPQIDQQSQERAA